MNSKFNIFCMEWWLSKVTAGGRGFPSQFYSPHIFIHPSPHSTLLFIYSWSQYYARPLTRAGTTSTTRTDIHSIVRKLSLIFMQKIIEIIR